MTGSDEYPPPRLAVICGRIVFCFLGVVLIGIPMIASYSDSRHTVGLELPLVLIGGLLVFLGLVLPPKTVAKFGIRLPEVLPDDD